MIVILYVMDSLRADFLSCYGYEKETSPNIDRLSREGVLFTHAFAQATYTKPGVASILTSTYPSVHRTTFRESILPRNLPTLAELLKAQGFRTIALSAMGNFSPTFGFDRGFDRFYELYRENTVKEKRNVMSQTGKPLATSEDINDFLRPLLTEHGEENLFIFIWSIDTHHPYFHRDAGLRRFCNQSGVIWQMKDVEQMNTEEELCRVKEMYEDMIYYNDHHFGCLIEMLERMNLFEQSFLILTGDHGEAFGEHGFKGHGNPPYEEQIRVPLIMKFPRSEFRGPRDGLVQHIDIMPTLLHWIEKQANHASLQGKSLVPVVKDGKEVNVFSFSESQIRMRYPKYTGLRTKAYKYIETKPWKFPWEISLRELRSWLAWSIYRPRFLFCLETDPREKTNAFEAARDVADDLRSQMRRVLEDSEQRSRHVEAKRWEKKDLDEEIASQLKALGYFDQE